MIDRLPTERFTSRVENYVRYRPFYPAGIIPLLEKQIGLRSEWTIADVGSGPGNLTRLFLEHGYSVIGIEPNDAMRQAGDALMARYPGFTSVKGVAENTTMQGCSIDLIVAGQAFHWFDPAATLIEFQRILKEPGWVALIWNRRAEGAAPVLDAWDQMLRDFAPEYRTVVHRDDSAQESMAVLFGTSGYQSFFLPNEQELDADAFWGRLISSSYTPLPGQPGHDEIKRRSQEIFQEFSVGGLVRFPYETGIYLGQIDR